MSSLHYFDCYGLSPTTKRTFNLWSSIQLVQNGILHFSAWSSATIGKIGLAFWCAKYDSANKFYLRSCGMLSRNFVSFASPVCFVRSPLNWSKVLTSRKCWRTSYCSLCCKSFRFNTRERRWHDINFSETATQSPSRSPESNSSGLNFAPLLLKLHQACLVCVSHIAARQWFNFSTWPLHSACESKWNVKSALCFRLTVLANASGMCSWIQQGCAVISRHHFTRIE